MRLVKPYIVIIFFSFALAGFSLNNPTEATVISCPTQVGIPMEGKAEIEVEFTIPEGNYIFVDHLSDNGTGILTSFRIRESTGFTISDIQKPTGKKREHEVILYGTGSYILIIADNKGHEPGTSVNLELEITTQLCNKEKGTCYFPHTFKKNIMLKVSGFVWQESDYENHTYKTFEKTTFAKKRIDFDHIDYPLLHAAIFYETNRQRALKGKKAFLHSPALEKAAKGHSDDMVKYHFFSHNSPVKGKETMIKRLSLVGITTGYRGENIAYTFGIEYKSGKSVYTPDQNGGYFSYTYKGNPIKNHTYIGFAKVVLAQWMASTGHRANILDPKFTYLGAGASHYKDADFFGMDNFMCTQNFGSTKGPAVW